MKMKNVIVHHKMKNVNVHHYLFLLETYALASVVLIKVLIDPSKYLDHPRRFCKNQTKIKHTKASFSTSATNGPNNKFDIL